MDEQSLLLEVAWHQKQIERLLACLLSEVTARGKGKTDKTDKTDKTKATEQAAKPGPKKKSIPCYRRPK